MKKGEHVFMNDTISKPTQSQPWRRSYPVDLDWAAPLPVGTIPDLFAGAISKFPGRIALSFMGKKTTYRETCNLTDNFAQGLQKIGIGKGDKVGLCLPNSPFYVIAYHGALKVGATVVNFNPLYAEKEIECQIKDSGVEVMVTLNVRQIQPKIEKMLGVTCLKKIICCELVDVLPFMTGIAFRTLNALKSLVGKQDVDPLGNNEACIPFCALMKNEGKPAPVALSAGDVAVLQYTGGTTGIPKAAQLTHGNLVANILQADLWFMGGKPGGELEKMLAVLPFFHVFSMTVQMNLALHLGAELIMLPKFEIKSLLKTIDHERPTIFAGVPTLYKALSNYPHVHDYDLSSLKLCLSGGAPLPEKTRDEFKALTGLDLVEGYGLSETSPLATGNLIRGVRKINSIGLPVPGTVVKISDLVTREEVPLKSEGEICIKGPQVMKSYWNRPAETAEIFDSEGYLRTGDIGYMDEDGYVFIVDRIKDMIIASGFKVFPRKVEDAILQHPAVSEVMVAGLKDDYRGETVKAWMVLKEGQSVSAEDMKAFLKDRLAPYEMPKMMDFRQSLPKTLIGKPDRKALLAEEAAKLGVQPVVKS
jgi:long-chain acyl-CoA synthetase